MRTLRSLIRLALASVALVSWVVIFSVLSPIIVIAVMCTKRYEVRG